MTVQAETYTTIPSHATPTSLNIGASEHAIETFVHPTYSTSVYNTPVISHFCGQCGTLLTSESFNFCCECGNPVDQLEILLPHIVQYVPVQAASEYSGFQLKCYPF